MSLYSHTRDCVPLTLLTLKLTLFSVRLISSENTVQQKQRQHNNSAGYHDYYFNQKQQKKWFDQSHHQTRITQKSGFKYKPHCIMKKLYYNIMQKKWQTFYLGSGQTCVKHREIYNHNFIIMNHFGTPIQTKSSL